MSLSKVSKARLLKLVTFMSKLPRKTKGHLNMKAWVMHHGDYSDVIGKHGIVNGDDITTETLIQCGMSACALGWGCLIPSFKKAGLRLEQAEALRGPYLQPVYRDARDMDAAEDFFRINEHLADQLFGPVGGLTSPQEWAKKAKKIIAAAER